MRYRLVGIPASVLLIVLLSLANASAQSVSTAQINGTVKDQSGGGLPGVTVTVTQTDTGLTRTAITDESGSYIVQNLPVGPYRFEAELQGFRKFVQTGIVLEVNANPTLNLTLQLGQVAETVTVEGTAAAGAFGNLENNSLIGPERFNVDMGIVRSFRMGERAIQFRAEAFNVFNRVNLGTPVSTLNSPNFGLITSAADARIIQLALKYTF